MSGQFQQGRPPTVQRGSGMMPRLRQTSTVGRFTPRSSATSLMPTGWQSPTTLTVGNVLTPDKDCVENRYMNRSPRNWPLLAATLLVFLFAVSFIGPFIAEALDTVNQTEVTA